MAFGEYEECATQYDVEFRKKHELFSRKIAIGNAGYYSNGLNITLITPNLLQLNRLSLHTNYVSNIYRCGCFAKRKRITSDANLSIMGISIELILWYNYIKLICENANLEA